MFMWVAVSGAGTSTRWAVRRARCAGAAGTWSATTGGTAAPANVGGYARRSPPPKVPPPQKLRGGPVGIRVRAGDVDARLEQVPEVELGLGEVDAFESAGKILRPATERASPLSGFSRCYDTDSHRLAFECMPCLGIRESNQRPRMERVLRPPWRLRFRHSSFSRRVHARVRLGARFGGRQSLRSPSY
jgi:hypothetical protein